MKVAELRVELSRRGAETAGLKASLKERLKGLRAQNREVEGLVWGFGEAPENSRLPGEAWGTAARFLSELLLC